MKLLFTLITFFLALPVTAQKKPRLPDHLNAEQLQEILMEARAWGSLPTELKPLHTLPNGEAAELTVFTGDDKTTSTVKIKTQVSGSEYLVISISDENDRLIRSDILRFHYQSKLFHRWQVFADQKTPTRILIGHPLSILPLKVQRQLARETNRFFSLIHWREASARTTEEPGPSILMRESTGFHSDKRVDFTNHLVISRNDQVIRREFLTLTKTETPESESDKSQGLLDRLLGRKDTPSPLIDSDSPQPGHVHTFPDYNCSFIHPEGDYNVLDHAKINPAACFMIQSLRPTSGVTIVAENAGVGLLTSDQLNAIVLPRFQKLLKKTRTSETTKASVNGVDFLVTTLLGKMGHSQISYTVLAAEHNGFAYQLIFYRRETEFAPAKKAALELAKNFKLIDPDRQADGLNLAGDPYENPAMGISFDPTSVKAAEWTEAELWQDYPAASYGCKLSNNAGMIIFPVDLRDLEPTDTTLASGFLFHLGLNFENQITRSMPHSQGTAQGHQYECTLRSQGNVTTYRLRVLRNGSTACLLCALGINTSPDNNEKLLNLLDGVQFTAPATPEVREKTSPNRKRDADLINRFGLHLYNEAQYSDATAYFRRASEILPLNATYLGNIINSLRHSGNPAAALELQQTTAKRFPEDLEIASLRPLILINLERKEEAADAFAKLYEKNYRSEDEFLTFLNLLSDLNRVPDAIKAVDRFVETDRTKSFRPLRWQHQVYSQDGQFEKALEMARKIDKENPGNGQARNDLILALINASQSEEALTLLQEEIKKSPNDGCN